METLASGESSKTISNADYFLCSTKSLSFSKNDYVRLVINSLEGLGFRESAERLKIESGIGIKSNYIDMFMDSIIGGTWCESLRLIPLIDFIDGKSSECLRLIHEQKYIEFVQNGDLLEAIHYLREELSDISTVDRKNVLSTLLICPDKAASLQNMLHQIGSPMSRYELQKKIKAMISPNLVVAENRLENLILQALTYQESQCAYTNNLLDSKELDRKGSPPIGSCKSLMVDIKKSELEDLMPCQALYTLESESEEVWVVAFSPDGKYLASSSCDGQIKVWAMTTKPPKVFYTLDGHSTHCPAYKLSWSADSCQLLSCCADPVAGIMRWDLSVQFLHQSETSSPSSSRNHTRLPMAVPVTKKYSGHTGEVASVAWVHALPSSASLYFVSGGTDRQLLLHESATGTCLARKKGGRVGEVLVLSPMKGVSGPSPTTNCPSADSGVGGVGGVGGRWVRRFESGATEVSRPSQVYTNGHGHSVSLLEGYRIVYVCAERWLRVAVITKSAEGDGGTDDAPLGFRESEFGCLAMDKPVVSLAVSAGDSAYEERTVVAGLFGGDIYIVHIEGGTLSMGTRLSGQVQSRFRLNISASVPSGFVAGGTEAGNAVLVWQTDGSLLDKLEGHFGMVNCTSWGRLAGPSGRSAEGIMMLASGSDDGTVKLWVSRSGLKLWETLTSVDIMS